MTATLPRKKRPAASGSPPNGRSKPDVARSRRAEKNLDTPIYDAIYDAVVNRRLAPGSKLAEPALCDLFGVSRTIVRQALFRLEHDRVVELTRNKGATVAMPSAEETREVFDARRMIEAAIIPLAIKRATQPEIGRLRTRLRAEHDALAESDHARWVRLAGDFHRALAELAGNAVITRIVNELLSRCSLIVAMYEIPGEAACEHDEHVQLVDHIELGDERNARAIMDRHLRELEARLQPHARQEHDTDLARALLKHRGPAHQP